jgi:AcrR family transcriptional regulator
MKARASTACFVHGVVRFVQYVVDVTSVQARTGARRRAATQQDLLDATKRLLERGAPMAGVSVADIVGEAGVVRTTFYLHFKDKLDLVTALAHEQVVWIEEAGQTGQRAGSDPDLTRPTVDRATQAIVARWTENHAVLSAIIETAEHDPGVREIWRRGIHEVAGAAAELFAAHWREHPELAPAAPATIAEVLAWMIERSCHQIARDPARADEVAAALGEVVWRVLHPGAGD